MSDIGLATRTGRLVVTAAVLGSGMVMLDGTVVNVALVRVGAELGASMADLQWITNGYLLALASLILLGGSLGDRFGRRRVFVIGVVWFTAASVACGLAQSPGQLVVARVLQGVGGALLTPGSLALLQSSFRREDRAAAIGAWSGLGGVAAAIGPFVGGWLVEYASWRWAFLLNVPIGIATVWVAQVAVPESRDELASDQFDVVGALLASTALGLTTFALIEHASLGLGPALGVAGLGIAAGVGFVAVERASTHPLVPLDLFASRQFSAANGMTLLVYAALGALFFFLSLQLQTVLGWGPLPAGVATLPITVLMLLLAARGGRLAARIGPRLPMTLGPIVCAVGAALLAGVDAGSSYWTGVLPGVTVFGLGLTLLVAPLTATVLDAAPDRYAGVASGVNHAVARAGSLLAVAALPAVLGLSGEAYARPAAYSAAYTSAMWICSAMLALGGLVSWLLIRNPGPDSEEAPGRRQVAPAPAGWSCAGAEGCPGHASPPVREPERA